MLVGTPRDRRLVFTWAPLEDARASDGTLLRTGAEGGAEGVATSPTDFGSLG